MGPKEMYSKFIRLLELELVKEMSQCIAVMDCSEHEYKISNYQIHAFMSVIVVLALEYFRKRSCGS